MKKKGHISTVLVQILKKNISRYYEEYRSDQYNYSHSSYDGVGLPGPGAITPGGDSAHYSGSSSQPEALQPAADALGGATSRQQDENYLFDVKVCTMYELGPRDRYP